MSPCQGHAKLMRHTEVNLMDAVYAVVLLESSVEGGSWEVNAGNFFPSPKIGLHQILADVQTRLLFAQTPVILFLH